MKSDLNLPKPKASEVERMEEVKFFLFASKLQKLLRGAGVEDELSFYNNLVEITHTNYNIMIPAFEIVQKVANRPQELEVAVTARYMNFKFKFVEQQLMYARKYKAYVEEYINNKDKNELEPKLPIDMTLEIIKFNNAIRDKLCFIYEFLSYSFKWSEINQWDS